MVPRHVFVDVLSIIRFIETHCSIPCGALRITDKANRRHLPEDAQNAIIELQYVLNEYFNKQAYVDELLKYCIENQCYVSCTVGTTDSWGLSSYYLVLTKGKIWFG